MDARSSEANAAYVVALVKLQYVNLGLYAWEYLTHLDHDWRLIRGTRPWRWPSTTWAYLICRITILLSVIFSITIIGDLPCTSVVAYLSHLFPLFLVVSASCLLAARTVAIWSRASWVIAVCATGLLFLLASEIFSMAILRVEDDVPKLPNVGYTHACVRLGPDHAIGVKVSLTVNHIVNWTMFSLTFVGLWRHRRPRAIGLIRVLWAQSLALLALAMTLDIPLLLMAWMEVNGVILSMGLSIASLLLGLGTTRMTRSLYRSVQANPSHATRTRTSIQVAPELSTVNDSPEDEDRIELCRVGSP
ncbi:hypothetical protein PENSPDRAFT_740255 [Peniophora sp. CONT]|nr:hypothetical protein PENSPDRAFT_740255 [Peniophora sp. CONT]